MDFHLIPEDFRGVDSASISFNDFNFRIAGAEDVHYGAETSTVTRAIGTTRTSGGASPYPFGS